DQLRAGMANGWDPTKPPVDVVRLPPENGGHVVGFDNTRPAVAQELGWPDIPVKIHDFHEPIDMSQLKPRELAYLQGTAETLGVPLSEPPTWGELLVMRTKGNKLPPEGTTKRPKMPGCPKT